MELVSIRCCRHKRRFDVPQEWAEGVCSWLCPQCYEKLSEGERRRYKPKKEVRPLLPIGKRVCIPKGWLEEDGAKSSSEAIEGHEKRQAEKKSKIPFKNKALGYLLPSHRVYCYRCKHERPCFSSWYEQSTILCPMCYSELSPKKREEYERIYGGENGKTNSAEVGSEREMVDREKGKRANQGRIKLHKDKKGKRHNPARYKEIERLSNEEIMSLPLYRLKQEVKKGGVSPIRAKIELRRRGNKSYYETLSADPGVKVVFF